MFMNGWGVSQDYEAARKWFLMAAQQNNLEAQYLYAGRLGKGQGGPKDEPEMVKWVKLSASRGYNAAMAAMGYMHNYGTGLEQDLVQAYTWYSLAVSHCLKDVEPTLELVEKKLTAEQLVEAQQLARQWKPASD